MWKKQLMRAIVKNVIKTVENESISNQWVSTSLVCNIPHVFNMVCVGVCKCDHTPFPSRPGIPSIYL